MKAITLMYDSLNKKYLSPYGGEVPTPNFERLSKKCVTFDNFYCGSMPCMPARRELHTGRYNFLIRAWGPVEPFDDSCPEILSQNGICTHFVSDHCHYWQDGGLTYHQRFATFEFIRGQEGDEWKGRAGKYGEFSGKRLARHQDPINREYTREENCCHARTFAAGMEFLEKNYSDDNWYLHMEYFDPHEPFDCPEKYRKMFSDDVNLSDWPFYKTVDGIANEKEIKEQIICYKACIAMCDDYLGKLLDFMDEKELWKDTMLIVNTDHGFMLGEHGYMAKNYMPCYNELTNIPFFMYDPRHPERGGERASALSQTIDIPATLLDYFGVEKPSSMQGKSLAPVYENDEKIRDAALFGYFGKHINVTDGRYVYMRAARDNSKLFEYTLMPSRLAWMFDKEELKDIDKELFDGFSYCGNIPMLKIPANTEYVPNMSHLMYDDHMKYGDLLFDLRSDKAQNVNIVDNKDLVERMTEKMITLMQESEAPAEQYERMGFENISKQ